MNLILYIDFMRFEDLQDEDVAKIARNLLGSNIVRYENNEERLVGKIVETEAYHQSDPATHAHRGKTNRNKVMFDGAGNAYVYFIYGMHYCFNIVTGPEDEAAAVLIRAVEPIEGIATMQARRKTKNRQNLCSGPAKFTQAFGIDLNFNYHDLTKPPLELEPKTPLSKANTTAVTRIGISQNKEELWRFYVKDSPFISKKTINSL